MVFYSWWPPEEDRFMDTQLLWDHPNKTKVLAKFSLPRTFNTPQALYWQTPFFMLMLQPEMPTSFPWGSLHARCAREAWSPPRSWLSSSSRAAWGTWGTWWARLVTVGVVVIWNLIQHLIESVHLTYK